MSTNNPRPTVAALAARADATEAALAEILGLLKANATQTTAHDAEATTPTPKAKSRKAKSPKPTKDETPKPTPAERFAQGTTSVVDKPNTIWHGYTTVRHVAAGIGKIEIVYNHDNPESVQAVADALAAVEIFD